MTTHTILFVQRGGLETRTYYLYDTLTDASDGILKMFEKKLRSENPCETTFTYDIGQVFEFIEHFADISCVVFLKRTGTYHPFTREWIKEKVYVYCRRLARQAAAAAKEEQKKKMDEKSVTTPTV